LPFNEEFSVFLEFHLCRTFQNSDIKHIQYLWCDGVSQNPFFEKQLTREHVKRIRKIVTKARIGKNGQDEYEMTINFGKHSLLRYHKGLSLIDCIPGEENMDWIEINIEKQTIDNSLM